MSLGLACIIEPEFSAKNAPNVRGTLTYSYDANSGRTVMGGFETTLMNGKGILNRTDWGVARVVSSCGMRCELAG